MGSPEEGGFLKLVRLENGETGVLYDPRAYLDAVESLAPQLPPGARRFACDPDHDDFYGPRCVKDLELVSWSADLRRGTAELGFAGNVFKHDDGLRIVYTGVSEVEASLGPATSVDGGPRVQLDEVLPVEGGGVSHEISFHTGSIVLRAQDLEAAWGWSPEPGMADRASSAEQDAPSVALPDDLPDQLR